MILTSFNISNESGLSFGWIIWTSQTIMITVFGSLSFFILPLVNSKNKKEFFLMGKIKKPFFVKFVGLNTPSGRVNAMVVKIGIQ